MKLALYLPNFRNHVTVQELEDLTDLAEELDFDSVWTLDRIVVPEASDRGELQYSFGMMDEFPQADAGRRRTASGSRAGRCCPWLAARTTKVRIGMSITDTPYRSPGVFAAECATIDHLSDGRLNVGVGAGWMPEEFAAASATHLFPRRHAHVRETIEICRASGRTRPSSTTASSPTSSRAGSATKPLQKPAPADLLQRPQGPRSARRTGSRSTASRAGSASRTRPRELGRVAHGDRRRARGARGKSIDDLEMCSMIWFVITDRRSTRPTTARRPTCWSAPRGRSPTCSSATRRPG